MLQVRFEPMIPVFEQVKEFYILDHAVTDISYLKIFEG
jgi:hypothetical protein